MSAAIPVLDHGFVRLVDYMGSDLAVVRAARVLPDAPWRGKADVKLIGYMMAHHHSSPFEQVTFAFEIAAPIAVFRQWHRHRTQSFNEISARYSELPATFYVPAAEAIGTQSATNRQGRDLGPAPPERAEQLARYRAHCDAAFALYHELLEQGWPRELSRMLLPLGTYSRMIASANLHNWLRFLGERLAPEAQFEIRQYAEAVAQLIAEVVPISFGAWRAQRRAQKAIETAGGEPAVP